MRGIAEIRHLIAHAGSQRKTAAIAQFSVQFALQHIKHVAAITPVIGEIACRVLDHADADVANVERAPDRLTALTGMRRRCDLAPVGDREGQGWNLHWQYPENMALAADHIDWRVNVTIFSSEHHEHLAVRPPGNTCS